MESIQISKGTSTVKNGYESVTGQINVEFKKPDKSDKLFISIYGDDIARTELNFNKNKLSQEEACNSPKSESNETQSCIKGTDNNVIHPARKTHEVGDVKEICPKTVGDYATQYLWMRLVA